MRSSVYIGIAAIVICLNVLYLFLLQSANGDVWTRMLPNITTTASLQGDESSLPVDVLSILGTWNLTNIMKWDDSPSEATETSVLPLIDDDDDKEKADSMLSNNASTIALMGTQTHKDFGGQVMRNQHKPHNTALQQDNNATLNNQGGKTNKPNNHPPHKKHGIKRPVGDNLKIPTPIFVLSLPKSGTTSLYRYFICGGIWSSHTYGKLDKRKTFRLGVCMKNNWLNNRPIIEGCGFSQMFSDIGSTGGHNDNECFYPSLQALDEIVRDYPNSTIIVSYRSGWHDSILTFNRLRDRWRRGCPVFPNSTDPTVWEDFYVQHRQRIRQTVANYPGIHYLEFDLKDPSAAYMLQNFTGISWECWGNCKPDLSCKFPADPSASR